MVEAGYLTDDIAVTVDNATAGGTSEVDSTGVDMTGYDGVVIIAVIGTPAANNYLKGQEDSAVGFGTVQDLAGSKTSSLASGTKALILDLQHPAKQFVRGAVIRGTSTTVDAIITIRYKGRSLPVIQAVASIVQSQLNSPAEGTA